MIAKVNSEQWQIAYWGLSCPFYDFEARVSISASSAIAIDNCSYDGEEFLVSLAATAQNLSTILSNTV